MSKNFLPEFIGVLDLSGLAGGGFFVRAMAEKTIADAQARIECAIATRPGDVYIANILQRVDGSESYEVVAMARVQAEGVLSWYSRTPENGEEPWGLATWNPTGDNRNGYLTFDDGCYIGL